MTALWIRAEIRETERRTPVTPQDARELVSSGIPVTVESNPRRVFRDDEYAAAGCTMVSPGSWVEAPLDTVILGIKELPEEPAQLRHTHVYFAHCFKEQTGAQEVLNRFRRGGGELLDVEYLIDPAGRRVVAFGYWAGYVGAALGLLRLRGQLTGPVAPMEQGQLDGLLGVRSETHPHGEEAALVIGSYGRSGRGAAAALRQGGARVTAWDREETSRMDRRVLLDHDVLVNCVVSLGNEDQPPFVTALDLDGARRLRVVADVTCDVTSPANLIPVNNAITTWNEPVRTVSGSAPGTHLDVIAIDNLPSLLPRESSVDFSAQLTPLLGDLGDRTGPWRAARDVYDRHR